MSPADEPHATYIAEVRSALSRISARTSEDGGAEAALARLEDAALVNVDAPVRSSAPGGRYLKAGIKRAAGWYLRYLGEQIGDLGKATVEFATALVERTDRLEALHSSTAAEVAELRLRVEDLERRL